MNLDNSFIFVIIVRLDPSVIGRNEIKTEVIHFQITSRFVCQGPTGYRPLVHENLTKSADGTRRISPLTNIVSLFGEYIGGNVYGTLVGT